jgi:prepilin-type N-terminal cleavage/methylation domain-containing protein
MDYQSGEKSKPNKKIKKLTNPGFTLIEMLTSLFVIAMVTTIFVTNYRSGNQRTDLTMAAQTLVADIHAAQNNTLGLVKYGDVFPAGGWGINFNLASSSRYILFADLSQPASSEVENLHPQGDPGSMIYNELGDSDDEGDISRGARVVTLPTGIVISSINTGSPANPSITLADVTFLPPDPKTNIFVNNEATSTVLNIILKDKRDNTSKTVTVNFLGLAEVIE